MNIEKSFTDVSGFFDTWVRIMEYETRIMEVQDLDINVKHILIISPPTDREIVCLSGANLNGETHLLCFTKESERIANNYLLKHGIANLTACVGSFFYIPFSNNYFDAVFTNCFFDFCEEDDFDAIVNEIKRVLKKNGLLFSVYMEPPTNIIGKIWSDLFNLFPGIVHGCHPVNIKPALTRSDFNITKDVSISRFGFPLKYIISEG